MNITEHSEHSHSLDVAQSEPTKARSKTPMGLGRPRLTFTKSADSRTTTSQETGLKRSESSKSIKSKKKGKSPKSGKRKSEKIEKPDLSRLRAQTVSVMVLPTNDVSRSRSRSGSTKSRSKKKKKYKSRSHKKTPKRPKSTRNVSTRSTLKAPRSVPITAESDNPGHDGEEKGVFPGIMHFGGKKGLHQKSHSELPMDFEHDPPSGFPEFRPQNSWNGSFGLDMSLTENSLLHEEDTLFAEVNVNAEIEQRKHSMDDLSKQLDALMADDFEAEFETSLHRTRSDQTEFTRIHKQSLRDLEGDIDSVMASSVASTLTLLRDYDAAENEETFL